jgi:hypothetical protein
MLKLNVGFNRKAGEANYGSRGASVNLELELDSGLAGDPERLKERIRSLFLLAKASVDEELTSGGSANGHPASPRQTASNGNGHSTRGRRDGTRSATASQVRALHAIADRQGIDLAEAVRARYGVDQPEAILITEASELIDELKGSANHGSNGGGR